jgi:hypothetical protein
MSKLNKVALSVIKALATGEDKTSITVKFNLTTNQVESIEALYEKMKYAQPLPVYKVDEFGSIYFHGKKIVNCRRLHNGNDPTFQPWLDVEKRSLLTMIHQNKVHDQTSLQKLVNDVQYFFHRPKAAILSKAYNLLKK